MENKFKVAAKAIIRKGGKYLVLHRSGVDISNPCGIDIPGGRLEFGEKVEEGLRREVREESGLEIENAKTLRAWSFVKDGIQVVGITYLADYVSGEVRLSWEHSHHKWVTADEIIDSAYPEWIKKDFGLVVR